MSEIIGLVGISHSPFATMLPPADSSEPGGRFLADAARVASAVGRLAPDAVVVIGPDQPFCVIGERINPADRARCRSPPSWPGRSGTAWPGPGSTWPCPTR